MLTLGTSALAEHPLAACPPCWTRLRKRAPGRCCVMPACAEMCSAQTDWPLHIASAACARAGGAASPAQPASPASPGPPVVTPDMATSPEFVEEAPATTSPPPPASPASEAGSASPRASPDPMAPAEGSPAAPALAPPASDPSSVRDSSPSGAASPASEPSSARDSSPSGAASPAPASLDPAGRPAADSSPAVPSPDSFEDGGSNDEGDFDDSASLPFCQRPGRTVTNLTSDELFELRNTAPRAPSPEATNETADATVAPLATVAACEVYQFNVESNPGGVYPPPCGCPGTACCDAVRA